MELNDINTDAPILVRCNKALDLYNFLSGIYWRGNAVIAINFITCCIN